MNELVPHEQNNAKEIEDFFAQNELLADPVTRRDYFEHLDEQEFVELVQRTANLVRTGDGNQMQSFDGEKVMLKTHEVPDQREKMGLIEKVWQTAQAILKDRELSDEEALDYAGLTVSGGILLTHPFMDGNGRTSRTLSYILMRGNNNLEELYGILEDTNGGGNWNVSTDNGVQVPAQIASFSGEQPDRITWSSYSLDAADDSFGGDLTQSGDNRDNVLRFFIESADETTKNLISKATDKKDDATTLDGNKLLDILAQSDGAVEYADRLKQLHRREKMMKVEGYLAGMRYAAIASYPNKVSSYVERRIKKDLSGARRGEKELASRVLANGTVSIRDQNMVMHKMRSSVYNRDDEIK